MAPDGLWIIRALRMAQIHTSSNRKSFQQQIMAQSVKYAMYSKSCTCQRFTVIDYNILLPKHIETDCYVFGIRCVCITPTQMQ